MHGSCMLRAHAGTTRARARLPARRTRPAARRPAIRPRVQAAPGIDAMGEKSAASSLEGALVGLIADEDTITGFLLAGVGNVDIRKKTNYLVVDSRTTVKQIDTAFKEFVIRDDIAIILISQNVANMIRSSIAKHTKAVPAVLEIPSKENPYDPNADSLLCRVKHIFGCS